MWHLLCGSLRCCGLRWGWKGNLRSRWKRSFMMCVYACSVAQSCPSLWPFGLQPTRLISVHGIFQAWILGWVAISSSRGSSQPRDWTQASWIAGRFFIHWAIRLPRFYMSFVKTNSHFREFPGSSAAETPCSQCRGPRLDPWLGTRLHMLQLEIPTCHN